MKVEKIIPVLLADYLLKEDERGQVGCCHNISNPYGYWVLLEDKRDEAGKQFMDVGIAEETAAAMAAGIAVNGGRPVWGVYSSLSYSVHMIRLSQDICINNSTCNYSYFLRFVYME